MTLLTQVSLLVIIIFCIDLGCKLHGSKHPFTTISLSMCLIGSTMLAFNVENVNFEAMPLGFDLIIWGSGLNAALFLKRRWADDALDSWINEWSPALVHYVRWLNDTVPATKKICNVLPLSFRERIRRHVKLEHGKG